MTNVIIRLQSEIIAKDAEIQALRESFRDLRSFVLTKGNRDGRNGFFIQVSDVSTWCEQAQGTADAAYAEAEYNETGPRIADGSHTGCTHGTYPGVPRVNGYHCPNCGRDLALIQRWNDTEARAQERQRQHWVAFHKQIDPTEAAAPRGWDSVTA